MTLALRFPTSLRIGAGRFRTVVLFAASAAASAATVPASAQGPPAAPPANPFAGGAYAVPISGPVAVAYGDPSVPAGTASPGAVISGPIVTDPSASGQILSGPTPSGGPVYMAPQVIGGAMPGSP